MTALSAGIDRRFLPGIDKIRVRVPLKAGVTILPGAAVARDVNGYGVNVTSGTTTLAAQKALGVYTESTQVTAAAVDGETVITVYRGAYAFASAASADLVTFAQVGEDVFFVDNNTIAKLDRASGDDPLRPVAGRVIQVDSTGIYVDMTDQAR